MAAVVVVPGCPSTAIISHDATISKDFLLYQVNIMKISPLFSAKRTEEPHAAHASAAE